MNIWKICFSIFLYKKGFFRAKINGVNFYSCYAPPRFNSEEFQSLLDEIINDALGKGEISMPGPQNGVVDQTVCADRYY